VISKNTLTLDWIPQASKNNNGADPILVEKVIRALLLLEGLLKSNVSFVFKGGTALMLHMNSSRRLSIDIDVIIPERDDFPPIFEKVAQEQGFIRVEEQERAPGYAISKAHYKFYYEPLYKTTLPEEYILLDILFEEPKYGVMVPLPVDSAFVKQEGEPLTVLVPSINDLLGDKLTAFAPSDHIYWSWRKSRCAVAPQYPPRLQYVSRVTWVKVILVERVDPKLVPNN